MCWALPSRISWVILLLQVMQTFSGEGCDVECLCCDWCPLHQNCHRQQLRVGCSKEPVFSTSELKELLVKTLFNQWVPTGFLSKWFLEAASFRENKWELQCYFFSLRLSEVVVNRNSCIHLSSLIIPRCCFLMQPALAVHRHFNFPVIVPVAQNRYWLVSHFGLWAA